MAMEQINGRIVVSTLVLMAAGAYRVLLVDKSQGAKNSGASVTITRVLVGGYILALVVSIIDLVGGPASTLAGLLMALAVTTALYAVIPDLFARITKRRQSSGSSGGGGGGGTSGFRPV